MEKEWPNIISKVEVLQLVMPKINTFLSLQIEKTLALTGQKKTAEF